MEYYKVLTKDMKSLGLRKNPTILVYKLNTWIISPTIKHNNNDDGGIWCCKQLSNAKKLSKYMVKKYNLKTRIFKCIIDKILYKNDYRTKTNKLLLKNEII